MILTSSSEVNEAVAVLRSGGLVAFPTETYYGLAVDPFNEQALDNLFRVKQRPRRKAVLVLISDLSQLDLLVEYIPPPYPLLMKIFWPGPLTLVFPARSTLSSHLTGGTDTIGVRLSPHPLANDLIRAFGGPITATSANRSGDRAAECPNEILNIFGSEIDFLLGDDCTPGGAGSTLVGMQQDKLCCIRQGCLAYSEIIQKFAAESAG
ncbi:MAG: L-threonylcarbamoyladenylate synthase [Desulfobulbaceae bacterium]|nr:L-threonylcarbamoyladenylate synthase [Desulfobulbaceae bacterium]